MGVGGFLNSYRGRILNAEFEFRNFVSFRIPHSAFRILVTSTIAVVNLCACFSDMVGCVGRLRISCRHASA